VNSNPIHIYKFIYTFIFIIFSWLCCGYSGSIGLFVPRWIILPVDPGPNIPRIAPDLCPVHRGLWTIPDKIDHQRAALVLWRFWRGCGDLCEHCGHR